jgi:hypothetical protein
VTDSKVTRFTPDPIEYHIGVDVTQERYNTLIVEVGEWFRMRAPNKPEPMRRAKRYIDACLKGRKPTDRNVPWASMATATLANRIRVACRWDMDKMKPLFNKREQKRVKLQAREERAAEMVRDNASDPFVPESVRVLARQQTTYGDDPRAFLNPKEHQNWTKYKASYLEQFPHLRSVNSEAELDLLCDLLVVNERLRLKMLSNEKVENTDFKSVVDNINQLKKLLGIHPDQLAKRVAETQEGSFTQLVARVQAMPEFRELREQHWVEELIMLFQMYHQPSMRPDMDGYQLDDVGLLGMTGCRTCACSGCGQRNFAGLQIDEVQAYLEKKGVLEVNAMPEPAKPKGPMTWKEALNWEPEDTSQNIKRPPNAASPSTE